MNSLKGKKLDHFFRQELAHHKHPFDENHWLDLERRMRNQKRNRRIGWWVASALAAMLLLATTFSLLLLNKAGDSGEVVKTEVKKQKPQKPADENINAPLDNPLALNNDRGLSRPKNTETTKKRSIPFGLENKSGQIEIHTDKMEPLAADLLDLIPIKSSTLSSTNEPPLLARAPVVPLAQPVEGVEDDPKSSALTTEFKPALALSVFAGPDVNGVNNLKNTGRGGSAGIALTYTIRPRLSISAGVAYAKKLYSTDFANYRPNSSYTFPSNPSMVDADCRVLDLPLNLNYTVWNKKSNAIEITAGISSYLMLKEDYYFDYKYNAQSGPSHYESRNQSKHYLGVINLAVGYQKTLNKELSIGVSPYVKLPVTDIGYGNVRLESAGITTNLKFNLRALKSDKK